jgi:hypothetical protein
MGKSTKCDWCNKEEIIVTTMDGKFCSPDCANMARIAVIEENSWMWQALN